jgi:hypothetical protein
MCLVDVGSSSFLLLGNVEASMRGDVISVVTEFMVDAAGLKPAHFATPTYQCMLPVYECFAPTPDSAFASYP